MPIAGGMGLNIPQLTCDQRELYRVEPLCPVG